MTRASSQSPPSQLSDAQLAGLRAWERRMVFTFMVAMIGLAVAVGFNLVIGLAPGLDTTLLILLALIVLYSIRLQFSQKCPGCGARLGFQTRLLLPDHCGRCGVALKATQRP